MRIISNLLSSSSNLSSSLFRIQSRLDWNRQKRSPSGSTIRRHPHQHPGRRRQMRVWHIRQPLPRPRRPIPPPLNPNGIFVFSDSDDTNSGARVALPTTDPILGLYLDFAWNITPTSRSNRPSGACGAHPFCIVIVTPFHPPPAAPTTTSSLPPLQIFPVA